MILCLPKCDSMTCWRKGRKLACPSAPLINMKCPGRSSATAERLHKRRGVEARPASSRVLLEQEENPAVAVRRVRMPSTLPRVPVETVYQGESKTKTLPYRVEKEQARGFFTLAKTRRSCQGVTEELRNSPQCPRPHILHKILAAYSQRRMQPLVP